MGNVMDGWIGKFKWNTLYEWQKRWTRGDGVDEVWKVQDGAHHMTWFQ